MLSSFLIEAWLEEATLYRANGKERAAVQLETMARRVLKIMQMRESV